MPELEGRAERLASAVRAYLKRQSVANMDASRNVDAASLYRTYYSDILRIPAIPMETGSVNSVIDPAAMASSDALNVLAENLAAEACDAIPAAVSFLSAPPDRPAPNRHASDAEGERDQSDTDTQSSDNGEGDGSTTGVSPAP